MKNPTEILGTEDLKILQEAQALSRSGLSETTGVALRGAASKVLQVQTDLSTLKGMILYSLAFTKNNLATEWQDIADTHSGESLPFHKLESLANSDSKYAAIRIEVAAYESLLAVIEDNLWALRSIVRFYTGSN